MEEEEEEQQQPRRIARPARTERSDPLNPAEITPMMILDMLTGGAMGAGERGNTNSTTTRSSSPPPRPIMQTQTFTIGGGLPGAFPSGTVSVSVAASGPTPFTANRTGGWQPSPLFRASGELFPSVAMPPPGQGMSMDDLREHILRQLEPTFNSLNGPYGGLEEMVSASGDYVFSEHGFDQVMSRLMDQYHQQRTVPRTPDEVIDALPRISLTKQYIDEELKTKQCAICQEDFKEGDEVIKMPCESGHTYCTDCIVGWLKVNSTCPVCRYSMIENLGESSDATNAEGTSSSTGNAAGATSAPSSSTRFGTIPIPGSNSSSSAPPNARQNSNQQMPGGHYGPQPPECGTQ